MKALRQSLRAGKNGLLRRSRGGRRAPGREAGKQVVQRADHSGLPGDVEQRLNGPQRAILRVVVTLLGELVANGLIGVNVVGALNRTGLHSSGQASGNIERLGFELNGLAGIAGRRRVADVILRDVERRFKGFQGLQTAV